ncbi:MAG TPA: c-type cytochrome [Gaiella sp.]|nr:c-type cytochrome [Gaiella sp.]
MLRWVLLVVLAGAFAVLVAGCGGGGNDESAPATTETTATETTPTETTTTTTETTPTETMTTEPTITGGAGATGDAANGEKVFASAGCGGCHTFSKAGSSGSVGPNLDDLAPSFDAVVSQVTNGGGAMPAFKDQLSEQEIRDVAAFVSGQSS